jgi:hypothetical protein
MKTEGSWNIRSIVGKVLAVLVLTAMTGAIGVLPAQSEDHGRRVERRDNDRYENRGRGYDRGRYNRDRRNYRAPVYRERVYVAPPVIYAPPRPPGVSIFLPPLFF